MRHHSPDSATALLHNVAKTIVSVADSILSYQPSVQYVYYESYCDDEAALMKRYSAFAIAREALRQHTGWERAWAKRAPKSKYDVIIVGAGGHGLATA